MTTERVVRPQNGEGKGGFMRSKGGGGDEKTNDNGSQ